jgi:hypothetical protein
MQRLLRNFAAVIGRLAFSIDVRSVEGDDARLIPALMKGSKVHAGMTKVNVHYVGPAPFQRLASHDIRPDKRSAAGASTNLSQPCRKGFIRGGGITSMSSKGNGRCSASSSS